MKLNERNPKTLRLRIGNDVLLLRDGLWTALEEKSYGRRERRYVRNAEYEM